MPNPEGWVSLLYQPPSHMPTEARVLALDRHARDVQTCELSESLLVPPAGKQKLETG